MEERRLEKTIPDSLKKVLARIGEDLTAARKVRNITQQDMADRMNVSRSLVHRMENGDSRVSFGAYAAASWIMGLEKNLMAVFDQENDPVFQRNSRLDLPQRVRHEADAPDLDF
ncbi:MAG: helix-turn-helix transcriptional regulator [Roseibium sp.]|uniref:helix-turn-helix domain-containing protein n=1 Tax=Roseibium sp. TaxID=1936156 RepID=UPI00329762EA